MGTKVDEPVKVGAVFGPEGIRPVWFIWKRRRYEVTQVTMRWQTKEGTAAILHLGVTDGSNLFELTCNQQTLAWRLAAVEGNGCE
jgi:hypothetical protein